jgi:hypothetical protein
MLCSLDRPDNRYFYFPSCSGFRRRPVAAGFHKATSVAPNILERSPNRTVKAAPIGQQIAFAQCCIVAQPATCSIPFQENPIMCVRASGIFMACTVWLVMAGVSHAQGTTAQQATYGACLNEAAAKGIAGDALRGFVDACMQRSAAQNPGDARESPSGGMLGPCYGEYCAGATGHIVPYEQAHAQCWVYAGEPSGTPTIRLTPYERCMQNRGWTFYP